jgi:cytochrome P450
MPCRYIGGVMIEGGSDTNTSFLQSLVLLLTAFPEVQHKAQEEVDRVVGGNRMPTPEDFEHMPYIQVIHE